MKAILHFDGDSFFASVEQAMNYTLRGKPVVTGAERGAATAVSIEAKRLGISRGMSIKDIIKACPEVCFVASDYTAYSVYARRMYAIVRRYTPRVEEYSIDECFADITGLEEVYGQSYEQIAKTIKGDLERSLGITFGVGLGPSKSIAKIASKHRKPAGFTVVWKDTIESFISTMPVGNIWGIGFGMAIQLQATGVHTALDFAKKDEAWLREHHIAKPYREIWFELNGGSSKAVTPNAYTVPGSIIKSRTFAPPSSSRSFVYSQLAKNIERACNKARQAGVRCGAVGVMLKTQDFLYRKADVDLWVPTADPVDILRQIDKTFAQMFVPNILYRATGISLRVIVGEDTATHDLFGVTHTVNENVAVLEAVDGLNKRYGKETIMLGASLVAVNHQSPDWGRRGKRTSFVKKSLEQKKKTIDLPFLGRVK